MGKELFWIWCVVEGMSAPIRRLLLKAKGISDDGETALGDLPDLPWRFFVVEDSLDDQVLARRVLEKSPYAGDIICVTDGPSLFECIHGTEFFEDDMAVDRCVIFLDINLVLGDGIKLLESLRLHPVTERMKIVMVTGAPNEDYVEASYRRHANGFIAKPLRLEHLDEIHGIMRGARSRQKMH